MKKMKNFRKISMISLLWLSALACGVFASDERQDKDSQRPEKKVVVIEKKKKENDDKNTKNANDNSNNNKPKKDRPGN